MLLLLYSCGRNHVYTSCTLTFRVAPDLRSHALPFSVHEIRSTRDIPHSHSTRILNSPTMTRAVAGQVRGRQPISWLASSHKMRGVPHVSRVRARQRGLLQARQYGNSWLDGCSEEVDEVPVYILAI